MNTTYMAEKEALERPERARQQAEADGLSDPLLMALYARIRSVIGRILGYTLSAESRSNSNS